MSARDSLPPAQPDAPQTPAPSQPDAPPQTPAPAPPAPPPTTSPAPPPTTDEPARKRRSFPDPSVKKVRMLAAGVIAFGIGFLIGSLSGGSKEEEEEQIEQPTRAKPSTAEPSKHHAVEEVEPEVVASETRYAAGAAAEVAEASRATEDVAYHRWPY